MTSPVPLFTGLVVDHGGVRGAMPLRFMQAIEEAAGRPLSSLFDLMTTASSGAISTGLLNLPSEKTPLEPRFTAREALNIWIKEAETAFPLKNKSALRQIFGAAKHDPTLFKGLLRRTFQTAAMRDALTHMVVFGAELGEQSKIVRISSKSLAPGLPDLSGMLMSDALLGATAAPTYYPAAVVDRDAANPSAGKIALIDGAFASGNMPHETFHLLSRRAAAVGGEVLIVHLGTGTVPMGMKVQDYDQGASTFEAGLQKIKHLLGLLVGAAPAASVEFMTHCMPENFISFNPLIDSKNARHPSTALDDSRPGNIRRLIEHAEIEVERRQGDIQSLAHMLTQSRGPRVINDNKAARSPALAHHP